MWEWCATARPWRFDPLILLRAAIQMCEVRGDLETSDAQPPPLCGEDAWRARAAACRRRVLGEGANPEELESSRPSFFFLLFLCLLRHTLSPLSRSSFRSAASRWCHLSVMCGTTQKKKKKATDFCLAFPFTCDCAFVGGLRGFVFF